MSEMSDPYRMPNSAVDDVVPSGELVVASRGRRFLTYLVDGIAMWVVNVAILLALMAATGTADPNGVHFVLRIALSLGATMVYYIVMEAAWGRTLGKFACGTIVVDENGRRPSLGKVVGRSFSRLIPFEVFSIFGSERRMWHDSLPGTRVVMVDSLR